MKGAAYCVLALLILMALGYYWATQRARVMAQIDRRLAALSTPDTAPTRTPSTPIAVPERFAPVLAQAQLEITAREIRFTAGAGMVVLVGALALGGPVVAVALILGLPMLAAMLIRRRANKRVEALIESLPHYVDGVRQLQSVGTSLSQALERALQDAPEIVQSYFSPAIRRLELGAPVGETMQQLAERLQVPEISMFAAAIRTNLRFGGAMSAVLRNLANILRDRIQVKRELESATSEAKVSSRVLIAVPLFALVFLVFMNPNYITFFLTDPRGYRLATIAITLQGLGILVLRRLMRLEF